MPVLCRCNLSIATSAQLVLLFILFYCFLSIDLIHAKNDNSTNTTNNDFVLTRHVVETSARAIELTLDIFLGKNSEPDDAILFVDEPDKAMVLKEADVCWGVFRGTRTDSLVDWLPNFDLRLDPICSNEKCCTARAGYVRRLQKTSFRTAFQQAIRDCVATCSDCEVVLTGHSRGGSMAALAAAVWWDDNSDDVKPTVITFGQPGTIVGECSLIDSNKYYRFRNTVKYKTDSILKYDLVPFLNLADNGGQTFLLGNDPGGLVHYGEGQSPPRFFLFWWWLFSPYAHSIRWYMKRFEAHLDRNVYPLGTNGWRVGHACHVDSECLDSYCINNVCSLGMENGDVCYRNRDCKSGHCCQGRSSWWWWSSSSLGTCCDDDEHSISSSEEGEM